MLLARPGGCLGDGILLGLGIIAGSGRSFFKALIILYFIAAFWLFAVRFDFGEMLNYRTFLFC